MNEDSKLRHHADQNPTDDTESRVLSSLQRRWNEAVTAKRPGHRQRLLVGAGTASLLLLVVILVWPRNAPTGVESQPSPPFLPPTVDTSVSTTDTSSVPTQTSIEAQPTTATTTPTTSTSAPPIMCDQELADIAERIALARVASQESTNCMQTAFSANLPALTTPPCWHRCSNGDTVVEAAVFETWTDDKGAEIASVSVRYSSMPAGSAVLENLTFDRDGAGLTLASLTSPDPLTLDSLSVRAVRDLYTFLQRGEYDAAATLLSGDGQNISERPDLRPAFDMSGATTLSQSLESWCKSGAICQVPSSVHFSYEEYPYTAELVVRFDGTPIEATHTARFVEGVAVYGLPPLP